MQQCCSDLYRRLEWVAKPARPLAAFFSVSAAQRRAPPLFLPPFEHLRSEHFLTSNNSRKQRQTLYIKNTRVQLFCIASVDSFGWFTAMNLKVLPVKKIQNTKHYHQAASRRRGADREDAISFQQVAHTAKGRRWIHSNNNTEQWEETTAKQKNKDKKKKKQPEGWTLRAQSHSRLVKPFNPCPPDSWPLSLQH